MRGAVCMVLLLLVPLASGLNTEFPVDPPVAETGERLLVLDAVANRPTRCALGLDG